VIMSPSPNIGGDVSPLSHRDRRPCASRLVLDRFAAVGSKYGTLSIIQ